MLCCCRCFSWVACRSFCNLQLSRGFGAATELHAIISYFTKVDWSLHGKTFPLAASVWHGCFYRPRKMCVNLQVCLYADEWFGNFFSYRRLSLLIHYNFPCSITTLPMASGIYWAAEEHCDWFHSQCGHVKLTKEQPCWLNNQFCYMCPRTGDVGCGAICQDALLWRASV